MGTNGAQGGGEVSPVHQRFGDPSQDGELFNPALEGLVRTTEGQFIRLALPDVEHDAIPDGAPIRLILGQCSYLKPTYLTIGHALPNLRIE